jgi:hypothetical protein
MMSDTIQEFKHKCVIIKIKRGTINDRGSIYGAARWAWIAKLEHAERADYALAVETGTGGKVIGVFKPNKWYKATAENDKKYRHFLKRDGSHENERRIAFQGVEANDDVKNYYLDKYIPYEYRQPGMAGPFLYTYP